MKFSIDSPIFDLFPDLQIGVLVCRGMQNEKTDPTIVPLLRSAEDHVRHQLHESNFKEDPRIAVWQQAHQAFGSNPNKFQPSLTALTKRVLKGGELPSINLLVDLYNIISLKYLLPVGGEDLDTLQGNLQLTLADGSEEFMELGSTTNDPPQPNEVIYRDDRGVVVRKFNWREADRTKLTEQTTNAALVIESLFPLHESLQKALLELEELILRYCGGTIKGEVLSSTKMECDVD